MNEKNLSDFEAQFEDFLLEVDHSSCQQYMRGHPEYLKWKRELNKSTEKLRERLGEDFAIYIDIEQAQNAIYCMEEDLLYRKGFYDGISLLKCLGVI